MGINPSHPSRARVILAFGVLYIVWGSTYLAIRLAIDTIPPFFMASLRFFIAGAILYVWSRFIRKDPKPSPVHWRSAFIIGTLLLMGGNGGVVWAEQRVPTGIAALIVATVPMWMNFIDGVVRRRSRLGLTTILGILLGIGGVYLLVSSKPVDRPVDLAGAAVLLIASFLWASGSIYSGYAPLPKSSFLVTGMEMLTGGIVLFAAGCLAGEWRHFHPAYFSVQSLAALIYLVIFGSLIGFSTYLWLLKVTTTAQVSTYAYVNPVVAVFLGWLILGEPVNVSMAFGAAVILGAVGLMSWKPRPKAVEIQ